ncbi:hypothetical protein [Streptomyces inhibens]|uniref:hypothetical protein n=1 Tax=Streptomyces inhibens TaxID=2293571 RepID=UPI001EE7695C|nr:hypothetical protein [Streptomyces inhibens]UKY55601.1 hypothetical protein KI385_18040 [Streptomyces inhibens]
MREDRSAGVQERLGDRPAVGRQHLAVRRQLQQGRLLAVGGAAGALQDPADRAA